MTFFPDVESYLADWSHSIFCYLMSEGGRSYNCTSDIFPDGHNFVFPAFHLSDEGVVSSYVTRKLHSLANLNEILGLTSRHSSQVSKFVRTD